MFAEQRHQHKYRPEAVDHAGDRRQQFGDEGQRPTQPTGAHLREEDRHSDGQRNRHQQSEKRRDQRAVEKRQCTEMAVHRIPIDCLLGVGIDVGLVKEIQAKLAPGHLRAYDKLNGDQHDNTEDAQCAEHHQPVETTVCDGRVAASEQKRSNRGNLARRRIGRLLLVWSAGLGLKLHLGDTNLRHLGYHLSQASGAI